MTIMGHVWATRLRPPIRRASQANQAQPNHPKHRNHAKPSQTKPLHPKPGQARPSQRKDMGALEPTKTPGGAKEAKEATEHKMDGLELLQAWAEWSKIDGLGLL